MYPGALCRFPANQGKIFLTFDDGPDPDVTPRLLLLLKEKNVQATFFCLGWKAEENPWLIKEITDAGHSIGTHGYDHLHGWHEDKTKYIENIFRTRNLIPGNLFRPPYGKITRNLYHEISRDYRIVLWSLLSFDYEKNMTADRCLNHLKKRGRDGDIVVFHENKKVPFDVVDVVGKFIDHCREQGLEFGPIV